MLKHVALLLSAFFCAVSGATEASLRKDGSGKWELLVDGSPFVIRGVGRTTYPDTAREIGVNTIRFYTSATEAAREAHRKTSELGFKLIGGLWISVDRPNNSIYDNPAKIAEQRETIRAQVRALKDTPGLIVWGLGNESEWSKANQLREPYWKELNELAKIVKEEDPHHPVMNVIAGNSVWKIEALKKYAPKIDIVGINSYGGAGASPARLAEAGWEKPYILTEFGPRGHWEVPKTEWDAPVEPGSEAKAANYLRGFHGVMDNTANCLGTVAFVWAAKQEITGTWYGMFLETGEKTPAVDALSLAYSGKYPANRSPKIKKLDCSIDRKKIAPGTEFSAKASVSDLEGDPLAYEWKVVRESGVKWAEGAHEPVPPTMQGCFPAGADSAEVTVKAPAKPGAYRLFLFVRDGKGGAATQNIPFLVE